MQTALWPATFGYWMDTLFTPNPGTASIFPDNVIDQTRAFFTSYVSGRGPLPAIRIGGQPYGILPVTAFSRIQWYQQTAGFRSPCHKTSSARSTTFCARSMPIGQHEQNAAFVGKAGDPHQTLLDILALTPSSVEYFSRNAESLAQLFNMLNLFALGPGWYTALTTLGLQAQAIALLNSSVTPARRCPICSTTSFSPTTRRSPPSSMIALSPRQLHPGLHRRSPQLHPVARRCRRTSLDTLREETGFTGNQSPTALLYLCLRHALMLGYYDTSYNLSPQRRLLVGSPASGHAAPSPPLYILPKLPAPAKAVSPPSIKPKAGLPAALASGKRLHPVNSYSQSRPGRPSCQPRLLP